MNSIKKYPLLTILCLLMIGTVLFLVFAPIGAISKEQAMKIATISRIKQLSAATLLYASAFDGRLPAASSMPSVRALLKSYHESSTPPDFKGIPQFSTSPQFNFNLAGVVSNLDKVQVLGSVAPVPSGEVAMWTSQILPKDYAGIIVGFLDGSAKSFKLSDIEGIQTGLSYQYDRKGVKLLPSDYMADQDPLKESK